MENDEVPWDRYIERPRLYFYIVFGGMICLCWFTMDNALFGPAPQLSKKTDGAIFTLYQVVVLTCTSFFSFMLFFTWSRRFKIRCIKKKKKHLEKDIEQRRDRTSKGTVTEDQSPSQRILELKSSAVHKNNIAKHRTNGQTKQEFIYKKLIPNHALNDSSNVEKINSCLDGKYLIQNLTSMQYLINQDKILPENRINWINKGIKNNTGADRVALLEFLKFVFPELKKMSLDEFKNYSSTLCSNYFCDENQNTIVISNSTFRYSYKQPDTLTTKDIKRILNSCIEGN